MRVFKFGGASVKDAKGVKNVQQVLETVGYENTLVVVSAMGKTTNALEKITDNYFYNKQDVQYSIQELVSFHMEIVNDLFEHKNHEVFTSVKVLFDELQGFLSWNKSPNYSFVYDQVVCFGEQLSTTIIAAYLNENGIETTWLDVRELIKTDANYRDANVNWEVTQNNIGQNIQKNTLYVTQGFLGSDANNFTTTLGREGSDYTAAILAYCLNGENVTIWKDVPGVLNADPRYFENAQLLHQISYEEAIELAFYGASVIHPKTLQPLQRKEIPLYVKSFLHPKDKGTSVSKGQQLAPLLPCFIVKKDQVLISLSSLDFSFIVEDNISEIFGLLSAYKMKVGLLQNSAISFAVCVGDQYENIDLLVAELKARFKVTVNSGVNLFTIRHSNKQAIAALEQGKNILLKQRNKETVQIVSL
jgi:aspartate kinase